MFPCPLSPPRFKLRLDRATLLPIGQYEDGSLTFAWPGFLKDAWEGGQRTLLDAARAPVPDAPTGTKWSSNVDALNVASLAPMAGIAGRAAGIPVAAAPAAPMKIQNLGLRAVTEPGSSFSYRITSNGADTPLSVRGNVSGDEAYIQWIGDWNNKSGNTNSLGVGGLRALREQIRKDYPNVTRFRGDRISGANPDRMQSVAMHANPDTASLPALFDYAMPHGAGNSGVLFGSKNAKIYDPPARPQRPFEADYPNGARADEAGRLTHTIDGDPIVSGATVVGRRTFGGPDEALSPAQYDAIAEGLFGSLPHYVPAGALPRGHAGRYRNVAGPDGPERNVAVLGSLPSPVRERVLAHEIGHGIEDLASGRFGIPQDGIKRDLATVYDTLNNPNRSGAEAASWGKAARPQDFGYAGDDIPAEHMAEAIRAYLTDPNYLKTVAPKAAARIREWVNTNPRVNTVIQFNANRGEAALPALFDYAMPPGGLLAPPEEPPLPGLLAYFTKDRPGEPPVNTIPFLLGPVGQR